jgi:membrane-associated PAP2 superfamily phosphatase
MMKTTKESTMSPAKQILYSLLALFFVTLYFEFSDLDLWIQSLFYDFSRQSWLLSIEGNPWRHILLYDAPKKGLVLLELSILASLLFFRKHALVQKYHSGLLIVMLTLPLGPSVVSSLKGSTNVACPYALTQYGGDTPYTRLFERYPAGKKPAKQQRCFPAGHASGGFALLALYFLPQSIRRRRQMVALALSVGWTMGMYKMLLGHHFFSHTLISMILCWLVANCIALIVTPLHLYEHPKQARSSESVDASSLATD